MKKFIKNYWAISIPIIILIIAILFLIKREPPKHNQVVGMVEAGFVDVAAQYPGRLDSLFVQQGDTVEKGQLLAVLQSTEINTVKEQALAAIQVAQNNLDLLKNGPREEAISSSQNLYEIAQHQYDLVHKTYKRMLQLFKDSIISGQEKDIIYFKLQAAKKEQEMAKMHLQSLQKGSRPELIQASTAILKQAEKGYELVKSISGHTRVYAPTSGIISTLITTQGEIVSIGYPMMTIQKKHSYYVQFNIRQDKMEQIQVGQKVTLNIPGTEKGIVKAKISQVSPALEFANWVPEKETGQFELRTFTIQCKPLNPTKGLRPGMTAALNLPK